MIRSAGSGIAGLTVIVRVSAAAGFFRREVMQDRGAAIPCGANRTRSASSHAIPCRDCRTPLPPSKLQIHVQLYGLTSTIPTKTRQGNSRIRHFAAGFASSGMVSDHAVDFTTQMEIWLISLGLKRIHRSNYSPRRGLRNGPGSLRQFEPLPVLYMTWRLIVARAVQSG